MATGEVLVVLDANALFWPFTHGVRLDEELARVFPSGVRVAVASTAMAELEGLAARRVPDADAARALAARYPPFPVAGRGDSGVLAAVAGTGAVVATADRTFQTRLRAHGIAVLAPRDRARLELKLPTGELPRRATVKARTPLGRRPSPRR
ncbi:MAG: twitching motility protein PilT [Thermoplasmata archaeon]|nr:twitching motility protein PilT [Thermoplasmata archaeon]